jgi:hypothetical protein
VNGSAAVKIDRSACWRHDSLLVETASGIWARHPRPEGAYLEIPSKGGRIALSADQWNLLGNEHTPLGGTKRADLTVTPRVTLFGE